MIKTPGDPATGSRDGSTRPVGSCDLKRLRAWTHTWSSPRGTEFSVTFDLDEDRVQHFRNLNRAIGEPGNWPGCYFEQYASFWTWLGGREEIASLLSHTTGLN